MVALLTLADPEPTRSVQDSAKDLALCSGEASDTLAKKAELVRFPNSSSLAFFASASAASAFTRRLLAYAREFFSLLTCFRKASGICLGCPRRLFAPLHAGKSRLTASSKRCKASAT